MSSIEYINSVVLTSSAANVTFSNIPQNYQDLIVTFMCGGDLQGYAPRFRLNNNSSNNYSYTVLNGNGSVAASTRESSVSSGVMGMGALGTGNTISSIVVTEFLSYSNTNIFKTILGSGSNNSGTFPGVTSEVSLWRSTEAINLISISLGSGFPSTNLISGSTFTLWGVR